MERVVSIRAVADVMEDLTDLDGFGVGATDAARRSGFPSAEAMEKWLERHGARDLWLRMKRRDPEGEHYLGGGKRHRLANGARVVNDPIIALLDKADQSGRATLARKADRVRDLLAEIKTGVELAAHENEARRQAQAEVERLQRELAEARAILRGGKTVTASSGPDPKAVRAWAAANDVECPAMGRVPRAVVDAYQAAQDDAA